MRTPENPDLPIDWERLNADAKKYGLKYEPDKKLQGFFNFRWEGQKS